MTTSDIEHPGWRLRFWQRRREPSAEQLLPALPPYHSVAKHRERWATGLIIMMLFCFLYGFFFSAFVPGFFAFFMFPLIILVFLVIWALPDLNWAPTRTLEWLFYATFISIIAWPNYLAIALPGLPWITMVRLTSFPMVLTLLVCLSMSRDFREEMKRSLKSVPAIPILLGIFSIIQLYSIAESHDVSSSIQKFIVAQTTWTAVFFAGAYVFLRPGQIRRFAKILWAMAVFVSLIAIIEHRVGHLLWSGHIPGILKVNDESVQRILSGSVRSYTGRYRAQATFSTALGLAEYLAISLPFVFHFATKRFAKKIRLMAIISIPIILYADYLTDAKLGTIGALFGGLLYIFSAAFQNWRQNKSSIIAAATLYGYPTGIAFVVAAMMASHRLSVIIFGNDGSHANSTDARIQQYTTGFQKMFEWPFGYGIGQGAETLGFGAEYGMLSIDTYFLSIMLEYGVVGFIVYFGMFGIAIYEGMRRGFGSSPASEDKSFLLPITVSISTFIVIKSVFSQQDNHPVVFMMLGALTAIVASYRKAAAVKRVNTQRAKTRLGAYAPNSA